MRAVAKEAGTTATAIYRHFRDKEDLVAAVHRYSFDRFKTTILTAIGTKTGRPGLEALIDGYLAFGFDNPAAYELLFLARTGVREGAYLSAKPSSMHRRLSSAIEDGIRDGWLPPGDADEMALRLDTHMIGLTVLYRTGRFGDDREAFTQVFREAAWKVLEA